MPHTIPFSKRTEKWCQEQMILSQFTPEFMSITPEKKLKKMAKKALKEIKKL